MLAYGSGTSHDSENSVAMREISCDYIKKISPAPTESLIVGPGGEAEILALRQVLSGEVYAMSSHSPEVVRLIDSGVGTYLGDIHDMPFGPDTFDFLYASNVLEHVFAPYIALMECRRVLKLGASAYFINPSFEGDEGGVGPFHLHCLTPDVWHELMHKTGFKLESEYNQPGVRPLSLACYTHYRVRAVAPPPPHDYILAKLKDS